MFEQYHHIISGSLFTVLHLIVEQYLSESLRLQSALSSSRGNEDKYQASHPNLRKLDTGGKSVYVCMAQPYYKLDGTNQQLVSVFQDLELPHQ